MNVSAIVWVIVSMVVLVVGGLAFTTGWILARRDRDSVNLMQAIIGAGFVLIAIIIVATQANVVLGQQNAADKIDATVHCNTALIDALAIRDDAQTAVNTEGVHFHEHMIMWLDTRGAVPRVSDEADKALRDSLATLIAARRKAIAIEDSNPLPSCESVR
jgi:hypothetical protein